MAFLAHELITVGERGSSGLKSKEAHKNGERMRKNFRNDSEARNNHCHPESPERLRREGRRRTRIASGLRVLRCAMALRALRHLGMTRWGAALREIIS